MRKTEAVEHQIACGTPRQRPDGLFEIRGIYAAAFFAARGNYLLWVEGAKDHPGELRFVIQSRKELARDVVAWKSNHGVPIHQFLCGIGVAKTMVARFYKTGNRERLTESSSTLGASAKDGTGPSGATVQTVPSTVPASARSRRIADAGGCGQQAGCGVRSCSP
jgi:hypothetical protein